MGPDTSAAVGFGKAPLRYAGIDIGSQTHVVAIIDEAGEVTLKPTPFAEDAAGYAKLLACLQGPAGILVVMEATGHYGRNLRAMLAGEGFAVALLNPLRTYYFTQEDLTRAKTDAVDALALARFAAQKRPSPTPPEEAATAELRELVHLHERLVQDFGRRLHQLHRLVDLVFPEFTRYVHTLDSRLATAILREYPTAAAFEHGRPGRLARIGCDPQHRVGRELAGRLIAAARSSVGHHPGPVYCTEMRYLCEDLDALRLKIGETARELEGSVHEHGVGSLLTTIEGLGAITAARIIAAVGDPARFRHAAAFTSYVGVVPGTNRSGLRRPGQAPLSPIGNARLRRALWMPTLVGVRFNPWLRAYYLRLRARGKKPKVALIAAMRKLLIAVYTVAKNRRPFVSHVTNGSDRSP